MSTEQNKEIVDSHGNAFKSKKVKDNRLKRLIMDNIWNILGTGLAASVTIVGMFNFMFSRMYANSWADFYGVDKKYFNGTEVFEDRLLFFFLAIILMVYPFIFVYANKKINSKVYAILSFFVTVLILFIQNILYTVDLIEIIPWSGVKKWIDNIVVLIVFLVSDIVIAFFIIIRNFFWSKRKYKGYEKVIFAVALSIYVLSTTFGVAIKMNYDISDKKSYEVIDENKVIISKYNDRFLVMGCEIQGETIKLKKGNYSFEEVTDVMITYHEYDTVICK